MYLCPWILNNMSKTNFNSLLKFTRKRIKRQKEVENERKEIEGIVQETNRNNKTPHKVRIENMEGRKQK